MKPFSIMLMLFALFPLRADKGDDFIAFLHSLEPTLREVYALREQGKEVKADRLNQQIKARFVAYVKKNKGFSIPASCPVVIAKAGYQLSGGKLRCFEEFEFRIQWDYLEMMSQPEIMEKIEDRPLEDDRRVFSGRFLVNPELPLSFRLDQSLVINARPVAVD